MRRTLGRRALAVGVSVVGVCALALPAFASQVQTQGTVTALAPTVSVSSTVTASRSMAYSAKFVANSSVTTKSPSVTVYLSLWRSSVSGAKAATTSDVQIASTTYVIAASSWKANATYQTGNVVIKCAANPALAGGSVKATYYTRASASNGSSAGTSMNDYVFATSLAGC